MMRKLRSWIARWIGGSTVTEDPTGAKEPNEQPANPFQAGADRLRTTASWLIGALAAVATVMLAGTQLSTIGELSLPDDRVRLGLAVGAALAAVAATAYAIYRLTYIQAPIETGLLSVMEEAEKEDSKLRALTDADLGLRANYPTLADFLHAYDEKRKAEYEAEDRLRSADSEADAAAKKRSLAAAHEEVASLRAQWVTVHQLAGYLEVRSRFDEERKRVLAAALVVAVAIVCFAWAANPPTEEDAPGASVAQNPTPALLTLTQDGEERLRPAIGEGCSTLAASEGIQVIALSSSASTYELVLIPTNECPDPVVISVDADDGAVRAAVDVS